MECNILAIITARGGSKGILRKNTKLLGKKPLILYTIESAQKSENITHLILSSDDEECIRIAREYGVEVPFVRPAEITQDTTPHLPVIQHALKFMENKTAITFDYVVILQPTSPFRTAEDIDNTIEKLLTSGADSAVTLTEIDDHPIKAKKLENDRVLPYCIEEKEGIRRQDLPPAYKRSGAVYAMKKETIIRGRLYGDFVTGIVVDKNRSIDIDTPLDWAQAEAMLSFLENEK